ncbi:hypothetical protein B0A48_00797 [Cryoendolithus antarcticus]|uniref:Uncharacterized protein n=1 Tax=Cryoendolithus antarcticus TaxID=1507870 RepID=A0A1V8TRU0_9PEZI|nr:hypothetical protein B0A48_00797 [Cryoendolithus antarcticus]
MDTEMDEPITTLRSSISSWDLASNSTSPASGAAPSGSDTAPPVDDTLTDRTLSTRVANLEAAILTLSLRLSTLEDSQSVERSALQDAARESAEVRNINAKRPQRQESEDFFTAARTSPSRLGPIADSDLHKVEGGFPQPPAEDPNIFTSLIRSINATRPQHEDSEDFFDAARTSTIRSPGTWDQEPTSNVPQLAGRNAGVSTALASGIDASKMPRQGSEDYFEAVRKGSLSTRRRPGSWDPRLRAAQKAVDDDAEKGECWPEWAEDDFMESNEEEELRKPSTMAQIAGPDWRLWRPQHPDPERAESAVGGERNPHNGPKSFRHSYKEPGRAVMVNDANFPPLGTIRSGSVGFPTSIPGLVKIPLPPTTAVTLQPLGDSSRRVCAPTRGKDGGSERRLSALAEKDRWVDLMKGWWTEP